MEQTGQNSVQPSTASRHWDWVAALLLLSALATASTRLVITEWTDHLNSTINLVFLGVIAGLALGKSRFPARRALFFSTIYGLFVVFWQIGRLLEMDEGVLWRERLLNLIQRLITTGTQFLQNQPVSEPLLFLFLMATLFWILSSHAGYNLTRRGNGWRATLPTGITLLVIQTYDDQEAGRIWFLAAYLFLSLLVVARMIYRQQRTLWENKHIHLPQYLEVDFGRFVLIATVLLILLSWSIPSMATALPPAAAAWQRATAPWWSKVQQQANNIFSTLRGSEQIIGYAGLYGESFTLGLGNEYPDTIFLTIEAPPPPSGVRYYWRARVYDQYQDSTWTSTLTATQAISPNNISLPLADVNSAERTQAYFDITVAVPLLTLYTAPQPTWISHPAEAQLAHNPDGTLDLGVLTAEPPLEPGDTYRSRSSLSSFTITQLREAGTDYPQWITDRYLQIPSTVTPRVRQLARQIIRYQQGLTDIPPERAAEYQLAPRIDLEQTSPYDVATAVTSYLRSRIQYAEIIPAPPDDQEPVDWFLFEQREGFCNYYATAEVILLRTLGIPARLAAGFTQGERLDTRTYQVLHSNSHTWPEVYFPGLGWVEFEPTASEDPLSRPLGITESLTGTNLGAAEPTGEDRFSLEELMEEDLGPEISPEPELPVERDYSFVWYFVGILGLALFFFAWRRFRWEESASLPNLLVNSIHRIGLKPPASLRRWALRTALPPMERAYQELNLALNRLGRSPQPADTPAERAEALAIVLPAASGPAHRLMDEYQIDTYSSRTGDLYAAQGAAHVLRVFSWREVLRRLFRIKGKSAQSPYQSPSDRAALDQGWLKESKDYPSSPVSRE